MINSNTSFGKLKEVIVGRELKLTRRISDITFRQFYREALGQRVYEIAKGNYTVNQDLIDQRNQQLDSLAALLTSLDIVVYRPDPVEKITAFSTPNFKSELSSASNVRDITLVYKDKIIETPVAVQNRYFENILLYDIFNKVYDSGLGGQWIRCPHTRLTESGIDMQKWDIPRDYTKIDPRYVMAIDGACFLRIGKDVIVNVGSYNQYLGLQWVKSFFPDTEFHMVTIADNHIDGTLICLRPGLFLVKNNLDYIRNSLPKKFRSWTFIEPASLTDNIDVTGMTDLDIRLASSGGMDCNLLSIDHDRVLVNKRARSLIKLLEQNRFDIIPVELDHGEIFAGGIHCSTLDLIREDEYISYT